MHSVSLGWVASTDTVDGYNVYRGSAAGAETTLLNTSGLVTALVFTDSAPVVGEDFYVVKASLGGVESPASNEVTVSLQPSAPTGLKITASS